MENLRPALARVRPTLKQAKPIPRDPVKMQTAPAGLGQGLNIWISRAASAGVGVKALGSPWAEVWGNGSSHRHPCKAAALEGSVSRHTLSLQQQTLQALRDPCGQPLLPLVIQVK